MSRGLGQMPVGPFKVSPGTVTPASVCTHHCDRTKRKYVHGMVVAFREAFGNDDDKKAVAAFSSRISRVRLSASEEAAIAYISSADGYRCIRAGGGQRDGFPELGEEQLAALLPVIAAACRWFAENVNPVMVAA